MLWEFVCLSDLIVRFASEFIASSITRNIRCHFEVPNDDVALLFKLKSLYNSAQQFPDTGGESHRQRAPKCYSGRAAQNVCTSCSCPNRAEKSEKAQRRSGYDGIARREGQGERYIRLLAPLESPGIIAAIVDETAPANLCVTGVPTGNPIRLVSLRESVDACGR